MSKSIGYKDAGVDIKAGEEAVQRIKKEVRSTFTPQVLTDLGKFGAFYQLDLTKYKAPVLVSSVDGVGTKLKVAFMMEKHDTIGEDLVNHCINDILVGGARPLFFLDYIGTGVLNPSVVQQIIQGMVRGCKQAGCALVGGEMAEMPGFYQAGEYDLAGSIVGMVEISKVIQGDAIQQGDVLIGLPSTGLHTNGYSLARKVLFETAELSVHDKPDELDQCIGDALLQVHRCYLPVVDPLLDSFPIRGMSHVTGGGIVGNTSRILPEGRSLQINWTAWEIPPIFLFIQKLGQVSDEEMRKSFNLGIGYIFIVRKSDADSLVERLKGNGESPIIVGEVV